MEVKQGILADAVARELKFFASLAKKTKEWGRPMFFDLHS